jgi:hypothetical protein
MTDHKSPETTPPAHKSGHSPGPWFYGIAYAEERGPVPFDYKSPGYYDNTGIIANDGTTVVGCGEYNVFHSPADARLLTAAPDLLEALDELVSLLEPFEADGCLGIPGLATLNRYRRALSRARGESSKP